MKKSQPFAIVVAIAIVAAFVVFPNLFGNVSPSTGINLQPSVVIDDTDDAQGTGQDEATPPNGASDEDEPPLSKTDPDGDEGDPASSGQPENAPPASDADPQPTPEPEPEPTPAPAPTQDLGPDIELGEGISDKRAEQAAAAANVTVRKNGTYTSKVEVALYIHKYGNVPSNFVTKTKARNAGWVNTEGNLWDVLPGKSIGGGGYTNEQWGDEPLLPETPEGRYWRECDINYQGGYRGSERLVYSDDGLVFYTGDHYTTFERLY